MDKAEIIEGIIGQFERLGMTYQQVSDASGISRTTVMRIVQRQTANPSVETLADIAAAVQYDINPVRPAELKEPTKDSYILYLQELVDAERNVTDKRVASLRAHYNMLLAEKDRSKRRLWVAIVLLIIAVPVLTVFVCWVLVYDLTHTEAGWFRSRLGLDAIKQFIDGTNIYF